MTFVLVVAGLGACSAPSNPAEALRLLRSHGPRPAGPSSLNPFVVRRAHAPGHSRAGGRAGHGPAAPRLRPRPPDHGSRWRGVPLVARGFAVAALPYAALLVAAGTFSPFLYFRF